MPRSVEEERAQGALVTPLIENCIRLADVPIASMTLEKYALVLGQQIGPQLLVPLALQLLNHSPLIEITFFEGDLLLSVLAQSKEFWLTHPILLEDMRRLLETLPENAFHQDLRTKRSFNLLYEKFALT